MDYSKMVFQIQEIPANKSVISVYPRLKEYPEFEEEENDKHLRICLYATDPESPFLKTERDDYEKRLTKIFDFLKIKDPKFLADICAGANPVYEAMVNRFFMTFCDNLAYLMWSDKLRMFFYISQELRKPLGSNNPLQELQKRAALDKEQKNIYNDLVEYEAKVFSDVPTRKKLREEISKLIQPAERWADSKQVV